MRVLVGVVLALASFGWTPVDAAEMVWQPGDDGRRAQLNRLECVTAQLVEVEVSSYDPFPVRNALVELAVGPVVSSLSRYPDGGDLHTLIFQLTPDELATVSPSDTAMVRFNPGADFDTWTIGPIDPSAAVGCEGLV